MKTTFLTILSFLLLTNSACQIAKSEGDPWENLKEAAQSIGFCVYHIDQEICTTSQETYENLKANAGPDEDVNYFYVQKDWADNRIQQWADRQQMKPSKFLIVFDIDQGTLSKQKNTGLTGNKYKSFAILNLDHEFTFEDTSKGQNRTVKIISNKKDAILSNNLWREFMSGRLGVLTHYINIELTGKNAVNDLTEFEKAFFKFQQHQLSLKD